MNGLFVMYEEEERTFEDYLNLPRHMRSAIIERMWPKERCVFSALSKLCSKEVKASRNYMDMLSLRVSFETFVIQVRHIKEGLFFGQGFDIEFNNWPGNKSVNLRLPHGLQYSQTSYDDSIDFLEYSVEHFKNLLRYYHKSIKSLEIYGEVFSRSLGTLDFGVDHLNNLEELTISTVYMEHVLPKLKHPLKNLIVHGETSDENIANFKQIYQTKNTVVFQYSRFNNEQLLRLSASTAKIEIGELTVENVYNFIRAWQNGTLGRRIEHYQWDGLTGSNFNCQELFRLLGEPAGYFLRLQHFTEPEKSARLSYNSFCLMLYVTN